MSKNSFKVLRPGINTTFQDLGRDNLYHVGLPFSGVIDKRNFLIANSLITNTKDCLLYTSPSPRDGLLSRMPSSA